MAVTPEQRAEVLEPLRQLIDPDTYFWRSGVAGMVRIGDIYEAYPELAPPISDTDYPGAPS
jgi:hypothetical protein